MEYKTIDFDLPISMEVDVAVVGGGCAGVTAAIAAARNGAKTVVIEREGYLGGNLTAGLVQSLHGYRAHKGYMKKNPHLIIQHLLS